ncbi:MAG: class I SAM-dependent methyltransferase [Candidatus Brocadia sp.]|jgi:SAM-dependent methyltransferase
MLKRIREKIRSAEKLIPEPYRRYMRIAEAKLARMIMRMKPDRKYLEENILPCLSSANFSRILFVGCKPYTCHYGEWFLDTDIDYWTTDIDPDAEVWGGTDGHITCCVQEIDFHVPLHSFDAVLLNGIFGYGINSEKEMDRTIAAIHRILKPGGTLMIGWNNSLVPDPLYLENIRALFEHGTKLPLPKRKKFPGSTHCYDFFLSRETR